MTRDDRLEKLRMWLRPEIRALQPYAGEPAGPPVRLDANESPFDVPEDLKQEILEGLLSLEWNRYPDPGAAKLRQLLARQEGVAADQIAVGNGSDEIIRDLLTAYGGPGTKIVFPTPTFAMYRVLSLTSGATPVGVPLRPDWSLDVEAVLRELAAPASRILFLARPNNPTGNSFSRDQVETLVRATDRLVVVDEAYRLFSGETLLPWIADYPHVAVLSTFSKSMSCAGWRVGWLCAQPEVIQAVDRVRLPYNLNACAQWVAAKILGQKELWEEHARRVAAERDRVYKNLLRFPGLQVFPSQANFLLLRTPQAQNLKTDLARAGIAVRGFPAAEGLGDCLRVTIGMQDQNNRFLSVCRNATVLQKG